MSLLRYLKRLSLSWRLRAMARRSANLANTNAVVSPQYVASSPADLRPPKHNLVTLAAVGFLAYYTVVMCHEVAGHGLALYLFGARHFVLTSTSIDMTDHPWALASWGTPNRIVSLAGLLATLLLSLLTFPFMRSAFQHNKAISLRLYLWLVCAVGAFHAFSYMIYSGLTGIGDWQDVIAHLPHYHLMRTMEVVVETAVCAVIVRFFAGSFAKFPGSLVKLAVVPYFASTVGFCLAGLRLPDTMHLMLTATIPSSLMGQAILPLVPAFTGRHRTVTPSLESVPFSPTILVLSVIFLVIDILQAPGVHFALP